MPDNTIQIRVGADMAKVNAQFAQMGGTANQAFQAAAGGAEPLNKALIDSHQSVHLLAEEMGIHLPRAVVGAVSKMLPSMGAGSRFGGTLHVLVVGEPQAGEWLAGTLNNAVDRGVNLTATSSIRGAPVVH